MVKPYLTDEEFMAVCRSVTSNQEGAKKVGTNERNFRARRKRIEERYGVNLTNSIDHRVRQIGLDPKDWSYAWDKSDGLSVLVHNPNFTPDDYHSALADAVEQVRKLSPKFPTIKHNKVKDGHCLVLNFTDLHFGGWHLEKATEIVKGALADAIARSSGYPIDKIIFVMGSDALHTDTAGYTTTKGTQQVTDGSSWAEAFKVAQEAYTHCIASLAPIAPVHCVHVSGNHDELMGWALSQTIQATFSKAKSITFDVDDTPRKYVAYGTSMLCFTHGDKVKDADLPMIVAHEAPDMWGQTSHRYIYMGHRHHNMAIKYRSIKENPGITLQWLRSPKPTDKWHRDNGYLGGQGITSFIHSQTGGQVASLSINL